MTVGYWPLDDASGTVARALVGLQGTYTGTPTLGQPSIGPVGGKSAEFGSGTYMQVPGDAQWGLTTLSFGCWIRRTGAVPASHSRVMAQVTGGSWGIRVDPSNLLKFTRTGTNDYVSAFTVALNTDYFVVATVNGGTDMRLYVNGVQVYATAIAVLGGGSGAIDIGNDSTAATLAYWPGRVQGAFVTPNVLSAGQVRRMYAARFAPGARKVQVG